MYPAYCEAEYTCLCGLDAATEPGQRGALLYNLGRIARAQGAFEQAVLHLRASLLERPNNRATSQLLAEIERELDQE